MADEEPSVSPAIESIICQRLATDIGVTSSPPPSTTALLVAALTSHHASGITQLLERGSVFLAHVDNALPQLFPAIVNSLLGTVVLSPGGLAPPTPNETLCSARSLVALIDSLGAQHRAFASLPSLKGDHLRNPSAHDVDTHTSLEAVGAAVVQRLLDFSSSLRSGAMGSQGSSNSSGSSGVLQSPNVSQPSLLAGMLGTGGGGAGGGGGGGGGGSTGGSPFVTAAILVAGAFLSHGVPETSIVAAFPPQRRKEIVRLTENGWSHEAALLCMWWIDGYLRGGGGLVDLGGKGSGASAVRGSTTSRQSATGMPEPPSPATAPSSASASAAAPSPRPQHSQPATPASPRPSASPLRLFVRTSWEAPGVPTTVGEGVAASPGLDVTTRPEDGDAAPEAHQEASTQIVVESEHSASAAPVLIERFPVLITLPSSIGVSCAALTYGFISPSTVSTLVQWLHQSIAVTFSPIPVCALTHILLLNQGYLRNFLVSGQRFFELVIGTCAKVVVQAYQPNSAAEFDLRHYTLATHPPLQLCLLCVELCRGKLLGKDAQAALGTLFAFLSRLFITHVPHDATAAPSGTAAAAAATRGSTESLAIPTVHMRTSLRLAYRCCDVAFHDYEAGSPEHLRAAVGISRPLLEKVERRSGHTKIMDLVETMLAASSKEISEENERNSSLSHVLSLVGWLPASSESIVLGDAVHGLKPSQKLWALELASRTISSDRLRARCGVPFIASFGEMEAMPGLEGI